MVGREEVGFRSIASRCDGWKDGARRRGVGGAGPLSLRSNTTVPSTVVPRQNSRFLLFNDSYSTLQREVRRKNRKHNFS
jgi:hypothetical protein